MFEILVNVVKHQLGFFVDFGNRLFRSRHLEAVKMLFGHQTPVSYPA